MNNTAGETAGRSQFSMARRLRGLWGDWGNVDAEDRASNERGLDKEEPGRLMSVYKFPDGRVLWIITEWDRSATTALLPDDY